jgi:hypothetical protein
VLKASLAVSPCFLHKWITHAGGFYILLKRDLRAEGIWNVAITNHG